MIVPADLQTATMPLEQLKEVIALHEHIVELQKGKPNFEPLFVAIGRQHMVYAEQRADVPQEVHIIQREKPIRVVGHDGLSFAEINETA